MSSTTFAVVIWTVIALGWLGFVIIAGALVRDALATVSLARRRRSAGQQNSQGQR